ncbi:MAG: BCD family MFS transporter [Hyphomicrobiaceae bacterium]
MKLPLKAPEIIPRRLTAQLLFQLLPFADAATRKLPLSRLLRLSLFQVSVGMTMVLLTGTLNRVMIVELGVSAGFVALMVSLPLFLAPLRALIGFKSDTHKSFLGWRRVPYLAMGTMLTFGGLAIMPFALLNLTNPSEFAQLTGAIAAGAAFCLAGAGVHTTQTAGLALASDLSDEETRPRVIALLYVMLLVGMVASALILGQLLADMTPKSLIQVIQGCAVAAFLLNQIALWKQEPRNMELTAPEKARPTFAEAWGAYRRDQRPYRLLLAVGLGAAAFGMQDILLEPFGAEVLGLTVAQTTGLTAFMAGGSLIGFALAARLLSRGHQPCRLAAFGAVAGVAAFETVLLSGLLGSVLVLQIGTLGIGFGAGLFAVGTLMAAMNNASDDRSGLALGAWGAVQATATGLAMAAGGALRDGLSALANAGVLGNAIDPKTIGYVAVYHIEILLLFATLVVIGPLARHLRPAERRTTERFGIPESPG